MAEDIDGLHYDIAIAYFAEDVSKLGKYIKSFIYTTP